MLLIAIMLVPLACLGLLAWAAARSWAAFAWLAVLPNLVLLLALALLLSMADRAVGGRGPAAGPAIFLLGALEVLLAALSLAAALLGLGTRWLLCRMRADPEWPQPRRPDAVR